MEKYIKELKFYKNGCFIHVVDDNADLDFNIIMGNVLLSEDAKLSNMIYITIDHGDERTCY